MAVNPMPWGGDVKEVTPTSGSTIGSGGVEDSRRQKIFDVAGSDVEAFVEAMLNVATWPTDENLVARDYQLDGHSPGDIADPGEFVWGRCRVTLTYSPVESTAPDPGGGGTITIQEDGDFEQIAIPVLGGVLFYQSQFRANGDMTEVAEAQAATIITIRRRTFVVSGLRTFNVAGIDAVHGRPNLGATHIRLAGVKYSTNYVPGGAKVYTVTAVIEYRPLDNAGAPINWNHFWIPDALGGARWGPYYLKKTAIAANEFKPYGEPVAIAAFLSAIGITL